MLVYELLLAFTVKHHGKIVKPPDHTPELETIGQIYRNGDVFLPHLVQEDILKIDIFVHGNSSSRTKKYEINSNIFHHFTKLMPDVQGIGQYF